VVLSDGEVIHTGAAHWDAERTTYDNGTYSVRFSEGAITGWAFTNDAVPAVSQMPRIASSVLTPVPDTYQAGQWTYSPSGLPISLLTGKLAADRVLNDLRRG